MAGCSAEAPVAPGPARNLERYGAPTVPRSLDVTAQATDPCQSLLSVAELSDLGFDARGSARSYLGVQECSWTADDGQSLSLAADRDRDLLADAYRVRGRGVFIPIDVAGFPAVVEKTGRGELNSCSLTTGLGPRQALTAQWFGKEPLGSNPDACELAKQASTLAIRKLPPAS
ncbi:DUF3558 domain-containing protein [Actinomycetospora corticicola]|nr:DUF3558 domain-containing protein [Actinomycetospora corticicola]